MKYFTYRPANTMTTLVGMEKSDIISTIEYYIHARHEGLIKPGESDIAEENSISIEVASPLTHMDQYISAPIREGVELYVNANAYPYLMDIVSDFDTFLKDNKRAELYKFNADLGGMWLLPRFIMDGIGSYDWKQHEQQMEEWLHQREDALDYLEDKGVLIRPNKGKK
jgi:hypothetical protein